MADSAICTDGNAASAASPASRPARSATASAARSRSRRTAHRTSRSWTSEALRASMSAGESARPSTIRPPRRRDASRTSRRAEGGGAAPAGRPAPTRRARRAAAGRPTARGGQRSTPSAGGAGAGEAPRRRRRAPRGSLRGRAPTARRGGSGWRRSRTCAERLRGRVAPAWPRPTATLVTPARRPPGPPDQRPQPWPPLGFVVVAASTITRTSGSVPLGRTSTRPVVPSAASAAATSRRHAWPRRPAPTPRHPHVDQHLRQAGHGRGGQVGQGAADRWHDVVQQQQAGRGCRRRWWPGRGRSRGRSARHRARSHRPRAPRARSGRPTGVSTTRMPASLHGQAEAEVGHHGHDHRVVAEQAAAHGGRARRWR